MGGELPTSGVKGTGPQPTFQAMQVTLRPPRAVVVFRGGDHWLSNAAFAMYTCGRVWGGSGFLLIPHHNGQVSRSLRRLARAYDPDYVVTLPLTARQAEAMNPGLIQMDVGGKHLQGAERAAAIEQSGDQMVRDPEGWAARNLLATDCTPHRHWFPGDDRERERHSEPTQHLAPDDHHGPYTPIGPFTPIEQFGPSKSSGAGLPAGLTGPWALAAAVHVGFAEAPPMPFAESSPVDQAAMTRLIREALRPPSYGRYRREEEPAWESAWQASETGLVKIHTWQGEQKPHLVVVGNSADDFALAQGWHVLFGNSHWIPDANLVLERPAHSVSWMLGHDLANDAVYGNKRSFLTSASVPLGQLQQLAQEWYGGHLRSSWDREPTGGDAVDDPEPDSRLKCKPSEQLNWDHGGMLAIQNDYDFPLTLPAEKNDQGDISLLVDLPPRTPSDSALQTTGLTWQIDLHVNYTATPHSRGLSPRVLQAHSDERFFELVRCSRHGVTCYSFSQGFVSGGSTQIQALAKPRLRLPGLYSWAQSLAGDHEMGMEFSEAGHRVEILRRMWGSRAELASDWAGPLRPIFLTFRTEARMSRDAFPEKDGLVLRSNEAVLSFQAMTRAVGAAIDRKGLRSKIDRLCLLGVMRRGLVLDCEACGYLGFIDLDTVSTVNSCARCGAQNPLTLDRWQDPIEEPTWWYDLHGAARELLAEDSGIAILCSAYLRQSARSYADLSELEFAKDGHRVAEIDLLASCDDRVIVGEAKSHPKLGDKSQRRSKAEKLAMVARVLHADEILLCTSAVGNWSNADIDAVRAAVTAQFGDDPDQPTIRVVTGLGTGQVIDYRAERTDTTTAASSTGHGVG